MSDTDPTTDHLSARLAAVERALTERTCDCAHESFVPADPPEPTTGATDDELRDAVVAVCEYALARDRTEPSDEHRASVRAALETLADTPSSPPETATRGAAKAAEATPREWLERVAARVFG